MGSVIRLNDHIQTKQLNNELLDLSKSVEHLTKQFDEVITDTKKVNQSINQNSKSFTGANKAVEKTTKNLNQLTALQKERVKVQNQTRTTLAKVQVLDERRNKTLQKGKALLQARNRLAKQDAQLTLLRTKEGQKLNNQLRQQNKELRKLKGSSGGLKSALGGITAGALGWAAAIGLVIGAIRNAVKISVQFEKQMDKVQAVTGASAAEMRVLSKNAKELGSTTTQTATQVGQLQEEFAKLGFSTKEILNATEATIALAEASGADLAQSAVVAASTLRGFGLDASETSRVVDVMAASFSSSSLDINKFETAMAQVAPAAKASGIEIEQATAMLGTLTDAGLDASTAGTSLRNIFLENAKSGRTFDEAMQEINNSTNKNATAMELFGKRGAIAGLVLADNTKKTKDLTNSLNDAAGAAQNMASIMRDNLAGDVAALQSAWEGFILGVEDGGGVFNKIARGIVQGLTKVILFFTDFRNKFIDGWNDIIQSSNVFRTAIAVLGNAVRLNFKIMIDAVLLSIEPFLLLGRVVRDIAKGDFENLKSTALQSLDSIKNRVSGLGETFMETGANIKDAFTGESLDSFLIKTSETNDELTEFQEKGQQVISTLEEIKVASEETGKSIKTTASSITEGLATENERQLLDYKEKNLGIIEDETLTQEKKVELLNIASENFLQNQIETAERELENIQLTDEKRVQLQTDLTNKQIELAELRTIRETEEAQLRLQAEQEIASTLTSLATELFNYKNTLINAEIARVEEKVKKGEITEQEGAKKTAELKRKQAQNDKNAAIFNAVINTAQGISAALSLGPIGVALAVLIGILGGVQVAAIASEPIPQFAKGVKDFEGGAAIVGEEGSELLRLPGGDTALTPERATLMNLPKGTDVIPHHETKEMLGGTTPSKWDELIKEQRATRKALSNQTINQTIVTEKGFNYVTKKGSERVKWINRYMNR